MQLAVTQVKDVSRPVDGFLFRDHQGAVRVERSVWLTLDQYDLAESRTAELP
jgi:hypothetical protein